MDAAETSSKMKAGQCPSDPVTQSHSRALPSSGLCPASGGRGDHMKTQEPSELAWLLVLMPHTCSVPRKQPCK